MTHIVRITQHIVDVKTSKRIVLFDKDKVSGTPEVLEIPPDPEPTLSDGSWYTFVCRGKLESVGDGEGYSEQQQ